jgi:hypothetical protein
MQMTRHCRKQCARGRAATFNDQEYMALVKGGGRLLTNIETIMKKSCLQQVIVKLCEFSCV